MIPSTETSPRTPLPRAATARPSTTGRFRSTLVVAMLFGGICGAFANPRPANAMWYDACTIPNDPGYLCNFTSIEGGGTKNRRFYNNTTWGSAATNNNDKSSGNRGTQNVAVYDYYNISNSTYTGRQYCLPVNSGINNTGTANKGSANRWQSAAC